jgi:hypothetical protein
MRRTYNDINLIVLAAEAQSFTFKNCVNPVGFVFNAIHKLLFPLRGFLDAIVYAIVNGWFSCLVCSPKKEDEEEEESSNISEEQKSKVNNRFSNHDVTFGKNFNDISSGSSPYGTK